MQALASANAEEGGFLNKNSGNKNSGKEDVASIPLRKQNVYIGV
jgi:hypothetical protein